MKDTNLFLLLTIGYIFNTAATVFIILINL